MKALRAAIPAMALAFAACGGSGRPSGDHVVAQAAGFEFDAETAAGILAPQPQYPPEAVGALADLWTQYFLLARAAATDSTLNNIDLNTLVELQVEGELVVGLRETVIQVDTALSEEGLRARFEDELPGGRLRARHILIQYPERGTDAQADSVRALVASLRSRIMDGEDFEALAREYSQDTRTASNGGDLGSFGRDEMFPQFESAAFALDVGEMSDIVETTLGLHLIRVDEKILPDFAEMREQYRAQVQGQMVARAESTYVANLVEAAEMEPDTSSFESIRQLAADLYLDLSPRALDRSLVRYQGGNLTLGEYRKWLLTSPPNVPPQVQTATNDQLSSLLEGLTQSELLVNDAMARGIEVSDSRRDTVAANIRNTVKGIARELGFFEISLDEGESEEEAADRVVRNILTEIVQEGRQVIPLQTIAYALKEEFGAKIHQPGITRAMQRINELRAQVPATPDPAPSVVPTDTTVPDTAGG
jgi:hypothetical protein